LKAVARVLVVDGDRELRSGLSRALEDAGHDVESLATMAAADAAVRRADIVVTDAMSPGLRGTRARVLVTSDDASESARIAAFEAGADDFVARPFSLREVVLRVRALLRRRNRGPAPADVIELAGIRIDRSALRLWIEGREVTTTTLEIRILIYLAEQGGRAVTRERMLEDVWRDPSLSVRVVDTSIRRLRAKLGEARELLRTLRNVGYQLRAD
jgi:two-component system phosphate regulon response regulator PhoB